MPASVPVPGSEMPDGALVAVPSPGVELYRLVSAQPPSESDFMPTPLKRAVGAPEILRLGLSHYLTEDAARSYIRRPESQVARVRVPPSRTIHIAKTGRNPQHVTVWARPGELAEVSEVLGAAE